MASQTLVWLTSPGDPIGKNIYVLKIFIHYHFMQNLHLQTIPMTLTLLILNVNGLFRQDLEQRLK